MGQGERERAEVLHLRERIAEGGSGAILSRETEDLDVNLVRFERGAGVGRHVNREVDVLLVVVEGSGVATVGDAEYRLGAGDALVVPKGVERAIRSDEEGVLAYLSVHRRRRRLWPEHAPRYA